MPEPWMTYAILSYTAPYQVEFHHHPAWQLTASLHGEFRFRTPQRTVILNSGDWILMSPSLIHDAGSDSPQSRAIQLFFRRFPPDFMPEFAERFNLTRKFLTSGHGNVGDLQQIASNLLAKAGNKAPFGKSWRTALGLEFMLSLLSDIPPEPPAPGRKRPEIVRIMEFMEKHFAEPIGVTEFAEETGFSESRFIAVFKEETGCSPMNFFNSVRMGRAQSFLLNGNSVEETARLSGFSSVQYFCRCFKKYVGVSPGEFRKNPFSRC